jgi:hypothetical protein
MHLERLDRVARAARHVAARRRPPREQVLVPANREPQDTGHESHAGRVVSHDDRPPRHRVGRPSPGHPPRDGHTCRSQPRDRHPPDSSQMPCRDRAPRPRRWREAADAPGCVRRPSRLASRSRTRPSAEPSHRRGHGSTSPLRPGPGDQIAGTRGTSGDHERARSGGELVATLQAPRAQHRPARSSRHAMPEAVALGAPTVVWLVRALHDLPPGPRSLLARGGYGSLRGRELADAQLDANLAAIIVWLRVPNEGARVSQG